MSFRTLVIASTVLLILLGASASSQREEDPKCPEGSYPAFETNIWQYNIPAVNFFNKIGSFFDSEWYIDHLVATQGKDNTIGSLRTGIWDGSMFTEELVGYYRSPTQLVLRYSSYNGTLSLPVRGFTLTAWTDELKLMSICGGTATYFSMSTIFCTDKVLIAYDYIDKGRRMVVDPVAKELNALVFAGTCPVGGK